MTDLTKTIPKGYKQTEIGVIPVDWDVKKLGDIGDSIIGLTYTPSDVSYGGKLVHRSSNIQNNKLAYKDNVYVNKDISEKLILQEKDILICVRNGSRDLIGKSALITGKSVGETFGAFMSVYRTKEYQSFVFYLILSNVIQKQINQALGATINQITNKTLNGFLIPYPKDLTEQEKIATALSDIDALIEKTENLIEKKKSIKQGAMQELLTGKRRLPGFSGEWEVKKLGEIADIYQPQTISQNKFSEDGYLVYGANGIVGRYIKYNHEYWQTTITCRGSTCGSVNKTIDKCWITGNAMVMNVDNKGFIDKLFFYFLLYKQDFTNCITGSGQPQIVREPLAEFEVSVPTETKEQTTIATILSDMDTEIAKLESELTKWQSLKQGMMQTLLTGKIRLIK